MTARRPLIVNAGVPMELPAGDTIPSGTYDLSTVVAKAGDTMTGNLVVSAGNPRLIADATSGASYLQISSAGTPKWQIIGDHASALMGLYNVGLAAYVFTVPNATNIATFTQIPVLPASDPTTANQATRKAYVDALFDSMNIGKIFDWAGPESTIPAKHLVCAGQDVSRTTYASLFAALCPSKGGVTVDFTTDVFTLTAHGLVVGDPVFLTTTGTAPTGMSADTTYYIMTAPTANTFTLGTTRSTTSGGVASVTSQVLLSTNGTGVHTLFYAPWKVSSSTTFALPDLRDVTTVGKGNMGGSNRALFSGWAWSNVLGNYAGEGSHTLLSSESGLPSHLHTMGNAASSTHTHSFRTNVAQRSSDGITGVIAPDGSIDVDAADGSGTKNFLPLGFPTNAVAVLLRRETTVGPSTTAGNSGSVSAADAASAHNIIQPGAMVNKIIYAGA